ncbi:MAG: baseplate J/gp47 family protein [Proteobacteria bacterium]|nr:baseplate J/gp47 family protein [Pseudomonadota bacterium]
MKTDLPSRHGSRPARPFNPPNQKAIDYRLTSHGPSFRRMLARLTPHMAGLSAGHRDDPTVALLDAWAMVADVLTFYQERIANEGYLRTATERRSIVELARHVYELDHGVSAATQIAFTVDDDAGEIAIAAGTRIMSVPVPGKGPETFETTETIAGRAEWNEIPLTPAGTAPVRPSPAFEANATELRVEGTDLGVTRGSWILVVARQSSRVFRLLQVGTVSSDPAEARTTITWVRSESNSDATLSIDNPEILWLRQEHRLLGYNLSLVGKDDVKSRLDSIRSAVAASNADDAWNHARTLSELNAGRFPSLQDEMATLLLEVHGFRQDSGSSARRQDALNAVDAMLNALDAITGLPQFRVHEDEDNDRTIDLAREVRDLFPDSWLVLFDTGKQGRKPMLSKAVRVTPSAQQQRFGLLSRTARIELDQPVDAGWDLRDTLVLADAEPLVPWRDPRAPRPAEQPDEAPRGPRVFTSRALPADAGWTLPGRMVAIEGLVDGQPAAEIATVSSADENGLVTLEEPLRHLFDTDSIVCNANLAPASHGETVEQVLGGGNSTAVDQRFDLLRSPLSFVASPRGPVPQLTVHVNGAEWQRVDSLDKVDGNVPGYMVRIRDDGTTSIVFGDGVNGARLPSGLDNVVATYRVGRGAAGNLAAGRLTLLPDQPPGVASAVNPVAARGGRDPDTIEQARNRAEFATRVTRGPITRTELEDVVCASGEVSKVTLRLLVTSGVPELVHVTVAGKDWSTDPPGLATDEFCALLERELSRIAPSPGRRYMVEPYAPHNLSIRIGSVELDANADIDDVRQRASAALDRRFAISQSEFGQVLVRSQVEQVLGDISGLQAFAVTLRDEQNPHVGPIDSIVARGAHVRSDDTVVPAELLAPRVIWP